jgi:hypothetical protein
MATKRELSQKYAEWLSEARKLDSTIKKSDLLTEASRKRTHLAQTLARIGKDLATYEITEAVRAEILSGACQILEVGQITNFSNITKAASNDDFTSLGDSWDDFFKKKS